MLTHRARIASACRATGLFGERSSSERSAVGGATLTVGEGTVPQAPGDPDALLALVATGECRDEARFTGRHRGGDRRPGRARAYHLRAPGGANSRKGPAPPVAVHDLRDADSLLLQRAGSAVGSRWAADFLIPHKTIVAAE
jgi:hypothetical protein